MFINNLQVCLYINFVIEGNFSFEAIFPSVDFFLHKNTAGSAMAHAEVCNNSVGLLDVETVF